MNATTSIGLPLSLEFFPPKTEEGASKLTAVRQQLYALRPEFCSVTYGAGGSTQDGTLQTVQAILAEGHEAVARTARSIFPLADQASDQPTADLLTQRLTVHEQTARMLRSLLED